jgi:hypothetical protein
MGGRMNIASVDEKLEALSQQDAKVVFEMLETYAMKASDLSVIPPSIEGITALVAHHPELQLRLVTVLEALNASLVGVWVCSGWNKAIKSPEAKAKMEAFHARLENEGSSSVKKMLNSVKK